MKKTLLVYATCFVVFFVLFYLFFDSGVIGRVDVFEKAFRQHFFTAFFSIGSFVFALMTAILFQMEERVYKNDEYIRLHSEVVQSTGRFDGLYAPLIRIGKLFIFAVFCCLSTSIAQISIGLINSDFASAVCMAAALSTICLILYVVYNVKKTMIAWFTILERR